MTLSTKFCVVTLESTSPVSGAVIVVWDYEVLLKKDRVKSEVIILCRIISHLGKGRLYGETTR